MTLTNIAYVLSSIFLLWLGAEWIVDSASVIARKLRIPELVIGLTVVAFGTSAPEFMVTTTAAFKELEDISLSNVIGSNILNLGLVLGLMAVIKPVAAGRTLLKRDASLLLGLILLLIALSFAGTLGRMQGIVLFSCLIMYTGFLLTRGSRLPDLEDYKLHREARYWDYPRLLAGFLLIAAGGNFMVEGARGIALALGVSDWLIGLTVVAGGTSLPELVTCLAASLKGRNDMLLGNLIGSDFFNFAGVLGLTCILRPLHISSDTMTSLFLLLAQILLVMLCIRTGWKISRKEGALLIVFNLAYWVVDTVL